VAVPRVFISSTYYDMRHVRSAVRDFVGSIGFEPVLSEEYDVFYEHGKSRQQACLDEIGKCDVYILIIGGRYGSIFPNETLSITHKEFRKACEVGLPMFSFIDTYVNNDYSVYCDNKDKTGFTYKHVLDIEVFELISEVESRPVNNTLTSFDQSTEITDFLRKQFARMFKERVFRPSSPKGRL
jgi:hypothetical protein